MVEHRADNAGVSGSNPLGPTSFCSVLFLDCENCCPEQSEGPKLFWGRPSFSIKHSLRFGTGAPICFDIILREIGAVAQLGEHLLCKQGVRSSILLSSTIALGYGETRQEKKDNWIKNRFF